MRSVKSFLVAACLLASPAAADSGWSWTEGEGPFHGWYLGLGIGTTVASGEGEYPVLPSGTASRDYDPGDGEHQALFLGYNVQRGDMVYGLEASAGNHIGVLDARPDGDREVMGIRGLRGRVGMVRGDFMFYGALGYAEAIFRVHNGDAFSTRDNETVVTGFSYGVGVEYNAMERWFLGVDLTMREMQGEFRGAPSGVDVENGTFTLRLARRW